MLKGELISGNVFAIGQRVPPPPSPRQALQMRARLHSLPCWQELHRERLQPSLPWLMNHFLNFQVFSCWPETKRVQGPIFYAFWFSPNAVFARKKESSTWWFGDLQRYQKMPSFLTTDESRIVVYKVLPMVLKRAEVLRVKLRQNWTS